MKNPPRDESSILKGPVIKIFIYNRSRFENKIGDINFITTGFLIIADPDT